MLLMAASTSKEHNPHPFNFHHKLLCCRTHILLECKQKDGIGIIINNASITDVLTSEYE